MLLVLVVERARTAVPPIFLRLLTVRSARRDMVVVLDSIRWGLLELLLTLLLLEGGGGGDGDGDLDCLVLVVLGDEVVFLLTTHSLLIPISSYYTDRPHESYFLVSFFLCRIPY